MYAAVANKTIGSRRRPPWLPMAKSSTKLSRALFWTCCCCSCSSWLTHASSSNTKVHTHMQKRLLSIVSPSNAGVGTSSWAQARPLAFAVPGPAPSRGRTRTRSRTRTPVFGSNSLRTTTAHTRAMNGARNQASMDSQRLFSSSNPLSDSESKDGTTTTTLSVEVLARKLANMEYTNIIALVGAGASCSAGIPDFRTPGSGLYDRLGKYDLPFPEAIFDLDYYTQVTPMPFVDLCQTLWPGQEEGPKPTPTHHFLKLLDDKKLLKRIYTQNIDGLESLAGVSTNTLVECHGHFRSASCVDANCKQPLPIEDCRKAIVEEGRPPRCSKEGCGGLAKPDIVFFGEAMPSRFQETIDADLAECDLLIVFGTSLLVMPVAGIPSWVSPNCPRVLCNLEPAGGIGSSTAKKEDLFLRGESDASVKTVCDLAGWSEDLDALLLREP